MEIENEVDRIDDQLERESEVEDKIIEDECGRG